MIQCFLLSRNLQSHFCMPLVYQLSSRICMTIQPMDLQFTLLDPSSTLVDAWQRAFEQHLTEAARGKITIIQSRLADLAEPESHFDCIVSPANSYGRLDGGFDYYISEALAPPDDLSAATRIAQATLYHRWRGYAPPGTCTLISLADSVCENNPHRCTFVALCPTMRIPGLATWNREVVYNCVWSLLVAVDEHNRSVDAARAGVRISKILMTGLATGVGNVSAERCAQQMALAIRDFEAASTYPEKWSSLEWGDAIRYADDVRSTHGL